MSIDKKKYGAHRSYGINLEAVQVINVIFIGNLATYTKVQSTQRRPVDSIVLCQWTMMQNERKKNVINSIMTKIIFIIYIRPEASSTCIAAISGYNAHNTCWAIIVRLDVSYNITI